MRCYFALRSIAADTIRVRAPISRVRGVRGNILHSSPLKENTAANPRRGYRPNTSELYFRARVYVCVCSTSARF